MVSLTALSLLILGVSMVTGQDSLIEGECREECHCEEVSDPTIFADCAPCVCQPGQCCSITCPDPSTDGLGACPQCLCTANQPVSCHGDELIAIKEDADKAKEHYTQQFKQIKKCITDKVKNSKTAAVKTEGRETVVTFRTLCDKIQEIVDKVKALLPDDKSALDSVKEMEADIEELESAMNSAAEDLVEFLRKTATKKQLKGADKNKDKVIDDIELLKALKWDGISMLNILGEITTDYPKSLNEAVNKQLKEVVDELKKCYQE